MNTSSMNTLGITDCSNPSTQIQMTYILHVCYLRSDLETTLNDSHFGYLSQIGGNE